MPFHTIARAVFSEHKHKRRSITTNKPNAALMESDKISQLDEKVSNESSITCDNITEQSDVNHVNIHDISCESEEYIDCSETIEETLDIEDGERDVNENDEQAEKSSSKIDIIDSDELDIACLK
jgi:hypothetical protein